MRSILGLSFFVAASLFSFGAHGQEQPHEAVLMSMDGHFGVGGGNVGFVTHAGVGGQAWLSELFAIGGQAGFIEDSELFGGDRSSAWYVGPVASIRTSSSGTYLFVMGGAGFGSRTIERMPSCFLGPCSREPLSSWSEHGAALHLAVGMAFHVGSFEIGPVFRGDSVAGDRMLTTNLAFGGVLTRDSY
jgi:hypothetical protein